MHKLLKKWADRVMNSREPDLYIGGREKPYMLRWYAIPRNPIFNVYLHRFLRSDYAEALHDHPWLFNASLLLNGSYDEYVPGKSCAVCGEPECGLGRALDSKFEIDYAHPHAIRREQGAWYFRLGKAAHRVQLLKQPFCVQDDSCYEVPVETIFITGPKIRRWGFYCPKGWRPWQQFLGKYDNAHEGLDTQGCD